MEKMKPWNKGFIQQRSFNMAQPKDSQTQTQTLERPAAQQPNSDGWGIGPQRTLINPGSWGQPVIPGLDTSMQMEWLSGLPKDERLEAKRLELQKNFSWDGFQVIRHQASPFDPVMTVRGKSVTQFPDQRIKNAAGDPPGQGRREARRAMVRCKR